MLTAPLIVEFIQIFLIYFSNPACGIRNKITIWIRG